MGLLCLLMAVVLVLPQIDGVRAWSGDSTMNTAICTASDDQLAPEITSDGSGGAIITWSDYRSGSGNSDIYARRVNSSGAVQWAADGVAICTVSGEKYRFQITSDGLGGAIITWDDVRSGNSDIYAQRVDSSGNVLWTANGVAICTASGDQRNLQITSDGSAGAIVTWEDYRSGNWDIYAQRVNSSGAVQWTANGVAICTASDFQLDPQITSDGSAGAIITWDDYRSGSNFDIYAQWVNSSGAVQWTANGVAISTASGHQVWPQIISDGSGGAVVTWEDYRSGSLADVYAQRVNSSGAVQWTANGVAICTASGDQSTPQIISDGSGGAVVTWEDYRSGNWDIYAQRVNSSGNVLWTANGVAIRTASGNQWHPQIIPDGSGGAIITWDGGPSGIGNSDIYAQRVNSSGAVQWTANGVTICTATGDQFTPQITSDGSAGAIITWDDDRNGSNNDIYAQWVDSSGSLPTFPTVKLTSTASSPTKTSPIPMTATFSEAVTGFVVGDITVGKGVAGNFVAVNTTVYSFDVTPSGQGAVTVNVAAAVAQDADLNPNTAATQYSITYDTVAPTVTLTSTATSPTETSPVPMTATFSEDVTGFVVGDITVGNGTAGNFTAVSTAVYTFDLIPSGQGAVTVNVAAAVAQDAASNGNTAATQYSITYIPSPTMTSFTTSSADEGYVVIITGTNFTGATAVKFGDTDALSFTVDSATQITAVVDHGTSGKITVTTAGGTATSADDFTPPVSPAGSVNWWLIIGIVIAVVIFFGAITWWLMGLRRKGG
jgi:hypothetical protein